MTEFRYGDQVWWHPGDGDEMFVLPAVVVDERRWGGVYPGLGTGSDSSSEIYDPEGYSRLISESSFGSPVCPVLVRPEGEEQPQWVRHRELSLVRPRVDED